MKLITSVKIDLADHTEVIDQAATRVGQLTSQAALALFNRAAQDAQKVIGYGGQARGIVDAKVVAYRESQIQPALDEAKESAIAILDHSKNLTQQYLQGLLQEHVIRPVDSRWAVHRSQVEGLRKWVAKFSSEKPIEDVTEVEVEPEQLGAIAQKLEEEIPPVIEVDPIGEEEDSPIQVLDPPVDDPLEDELTVPEDPAPVATSASQSQGKRSTSKSNKLTLADVMRQEAAKSKS